MTDTVCPGSATRCSVWTILGSINGAQEWDSAWPLLTQQSGHLGLGLGTQEQGLKSIFQQHSGGHKGALGQGPGQVPSANQGRGSTGATRVQQCQQQQGPTGLAMGWFGSGRPTSLWCCPTSSQLWHCESNPMTRWQLPLCHRGFAWPVLERPRMQLT